MKTHQWHCCNSRCVHWEFCAQSNQLEAEQEEEGHWSPKVEEWNFLLQLLDHLPVGFITVH